MLLKKSNCSDQGPREGSLAFCIWGYLERSLTSSIRGHHERSLTSSVRGHHEGSVTSSVLGHHEGSLTSSVKCHHERSLTSSIRGHHEGSLTSSVLGHYEGSLTSCLLYYLLRHLRFRHLFLLLVFSIPLGECVGVVALAGGSASLCSTNHAIQRPPFIDIDWNNLAVCALLQPQQQADENKQNRQQQIKTQTNQDGQYLYCNTKDTYFTAGVTSSSLWVSVEGSRYIFPTTLVTDAWNLVCVGYTTQQHQVWARAGEIFLNWTSIEETLGIVPEDIEVCVGSHLNHLRSFTGLVAAVSIHPGLTNSSTESVTNCSSLVGNTDAAIPINSTWISQGNVLLVDYSLEELCSQSVNSFLLKEPCDYNGMLRICKGFGGHFPTEEEVSQGLEVTNSIANCITDEKQVSWVGSEGSYGEGLTALCPTLLTNGTLGSRACLSELECSICRVPATLRFTLYGAIHEFDRYYFLNIMPDGNIYFEGQETCNITQEGNKWVLRSRLHRREWRLKRGSQPVGRRPWYSGDDNKTLTLTSCNILQFSSHDGVCLPRSQRCDGSKDSPDGSDEEGCRKRLVDKEPGYEHEVTPANDLSEQGIVTYNYEIFNIDQITNEKGMAHLEIGFFMSWHDPRIRFWDLGENLNFISCDEIWYPKLGMFAGYKQGPWIKMECYSSRCNTRKHMNAIEQHDLNDAFMGRFLTGRQQSLRVYSECRVSFPCKFHLHHFPFGRQMCNGSFFILKAITEMKWQHKNNATGPYKVNYKSEDYLLDYRLIKITGETTVDSHWSGRQMTFAIITLHLQSLCDYHLLNSFAPSALMFIISYSTLFFPIKEFNERIMVSLTSLLVLTGLFAQATNSYVKTPYYKLLDIWYAILITLCFCIVIANVAVNLAKVSRNKSYSSVYDGENEEAALSLSKAKRLNFVSLALFLFLFLLLISIYVCFALEVI